MACLGELTVGGDGLGLLVKVSGLHARGKEADVDGLAGTEGGGLAAAGGIATAGETHAPLGVLITNEGLSCRKKSTYVPCVC